jgi:hypothetical protein
MDLSKHAPSFRQPLPDALQGGPFPVLVRPPAQKIADKENKSEDQHIPKTAYEVNHPQKKPGGGSGDSSLIPFPDL